jgi:hypothetical protein
MSNVLHIDIGKWFLGVSMLPFLPRVTIQEKVARVTLWLERRRKDLVIFASPVQIPLWDVGAGPSDKTV